MKIIKERNKNPGIFVFQRSHVFVKITRFRQRSTSMSSKILTHQISDSTFFCVGETHRSSVWMALNHDFVID